MMQSISGILDRRPNARVVVVGGDEVSYGSPPPTENNWREFMQARAKFDPRRVHFFNRVPYSVFQQVLSISKAHVYLTYPFVLSWSMLEAMSHECMLIASRTAPVTEVVRDGVNGRLVNFHKPDEVVDAVVAALENQDAMAAFRKAARETVVKNYDLRTVCLPAQMDLISTLAEDRRPPRIKQPWTPATDS